MFEDVALLAATVKGFLQESLECLGSRDIHVVGLSFVTPGKNNAKENGRHHFFLARTRLAECLVVRTILNAQIRGGADPVL